MPINSMILCKFRGCEFTPFRSQKDLPVELLPGTIVNRTYGSYKNIYNYLFLLTIFGPIYYGPPQYYTGTIKWYTWYSAEWSVPNARSVLYCAWHARTDTSKLRVVEIST